MKKLIFLMCFVAAACQPNKSWSPEVVANLMNSCQKSGGSKEYCSCVTKEFQMKTEHEFSLLEVKAAQGDKKSIDEFMKVAASCRKG